MNEDKEREERSLTLPKEDKESTSPHAPPRAREGVPTLEEVISRAESTIGFRDVKWLTNWYNFMALADWSDEYGHPLRNWGHMLGKYIKNRALFDELRNPARLRNRDKDSTSKKPSNYRPTKKENLENAF